MTDAQKIAIGLGLVYGIPGACAFLFWTLVRAWANVIQGRDVMARFRPDRRDVAATERRLGVN